MKHSQQRTQWTDPAKAACKTFDQATLFQLVSDYLRIKGVKKARTRKNTKISYQLGIKVFLEYCQSNKQSPAKIKEDDASEYLAHLQDTTSRFGKPLADTTIANYITGAKTLYSALVWCYAVTVNPFTNVNAPIKHVRGPRKPRVPENNYQNLLQMLSGIDPHSIRDKAIIMLFGDAGCRIGDIVNLTLKDLDLANNMIHLYDRKGGLDTPNKHINPGTREALKAWLSIRSQYSAAGVKAVFTNFGDRVTDEYQHQALGKRTIARIIEKRFKQAGVPYTVKGTHALRRRFASEHHARNRDLQMTQIAMDHASPATTIMYTHIDPEQLKQSINALGSSEPPTLATLEQLLKTHPKAKREIQALMDVLNSTK